MKHLWTDWSSSKVKAWDLNERRQAEPVPWLALEVVGPSARHRCWIFITATLLEAVLLLLFFSWMCGFRPLAHITGALMHVWALQQRPRATFPGAHSPFARFASRHLKAHETPASGRPHLAGKHARRRTFTILSPRAALWNLQRAFSSKVLSVTFETGKFDSIPPAPPECQVSVNFCFKCNLNQ